MLTLACANSSQHTVNLHSTPFAVSSVQNTRSKHNQFQRKTNMTIINSRHCITASLLQHEDLRPNLSPSSTFRLKPISLITQCIITTERRTYILPRILLSFFFLFSPPNLLALGMKLNQNRPHARK